MAGKQDESPENPGKQGDPESNRGFLGLMQSVIAAIFGIQSEKNRQADFRKGDASQFITMGIVAVIALVVTMIIVVNSVLDSAAH